MKRVIIIGDEIVEHRLAKETHDLGATGFTFYIVHGVGAKGQRPRHAESANVKIEKRYSRSTCSGQIRVPKLCSLSSHRTDRFIHTSQSNSQTPQFPVPNPLNT
jgi:hypothetical protein